MRTIRIKNNAGATLYTRDVSDPGSEVIPTYAEGVAWAKVHCELVNKMNPSSPNWADDATTGAVLSAKICPECGSALP